MHVEAPSEHTIWDEPPMAYVEPLIDDANAVASMCENVVCMYVYTCVLEKFSCMRMCMCTRVLHTWIECQNVSIMRQYSADLIAL